VYLNFLIMAYKVKGWGKLFRLMGIGWYIGLSILLPLLGGRWIDRRLDIPFFFTFLGMGLGLLIAFIGVYYFLQPAMKREGKENEGVSH